MNLSEYEQMQPHVFAHGLTWLTPNQHCAWRVDSLMTKEADTIAWINQMQEGDVLYDVGANMGQYSMLAALRGVRVHAFEPESQNFALLCRNIAINKLSHLITAWPVALTDFTKLDTFHVQSLMAGGSCNSFGESVNFHLQPKDYAFQQGVYGTTINNFSNQFGLPAHIKIDVDGLEHKVIAGGHNHLHKKAIKSILVETNTHLQEHNAMAEVLRGYGFVADTITAEKARRKEGPFTGIGNVIYYRDEADFLTGKTCQPNTDGECEACQ